MSAYDDDDDDCGCDWPPTCGGFGVVYCNGCAGDFCACACGGESECFGCSECDEREDDD